MFTRFLNTSKQTLTYEHLPALWNEARQNQIEHLDLSQNEFTQITLPTVPLPAVRLLDISYNKAEIGELIIKADIFPNLEYLYVAKSNVEKFQIVGELGKLKELNLTRNALTHIPIDFLAKMPNLERLVLKENPIEDSIIAGFLGKGDNVYTFIKEYLDKESEEGTGEDNERKVLLIGNGNVGKSCFARRLVTDIFEKNWLSTHGISILQYNKDGFPYVLNLWDFGGQDIYHATHRLFMQSKAVYLLFWDWETEANPTTEIVEVGKARCYQNHKLPYWLRYAQSQGEGSPIIIIQTKTGKDGEKQKNTRLS